MIVSVNRGDLVNAIADVIGFTGKGSTMPINAAILLTADKEHGLTLSATDLEIGAVAECEAAVTEPGSVAVNGKALSSVIKSMPDGPVSLSEESGSLVLEIKGGNAEFKLTCMYPDDFPAMKAAEASLTDVSASLLLGLLDRVFFAVSQDETRYSLNGVYVLTEGDNLVMVATDGHRLAKAVQVGSADGLGRGVIIPRRGVAELRRILDRQEENVSVGVHADVFYLKAGGIMVQARLVSGEFPDYNQVVPSETNRTVIVDRVSLIDSLKRASVLSFDKAWGLSIEFGAGKIAISSSNPNVGEFSDLVEPESYEGEPIKMGFNARYLLDALTALDCEQVSILLKDPMLPCIVQAAEDDGYLCVVMPMRI